MAERVDFDIEEIRNFGRDVEAFTQEAEDIVGRMNAALTTVRETWQDRQIDKAAESIAEANASIMRSVNEIYPLVCERLRRQEEFIADWEAI